MTTTALVTGSNKGIGRETVRRLAGLGWTVWLGARDAERGTAAVRELATGGADVRYLPLDVTSDESVQRAVETVTSHGGLDVLVNNAGVGGPRKTPAETTAADLLACFGVNLLGPVRVTHAFLPLLQRSDHPRVVMVSSGMGSLAITTDPERAESTFLGLIYPSSKAALNMVTTMYAKALPQLRINAADPGYTATDLNDHTGYRTVEQGAEVVVALAQTAPDGATGGFFDDSGVVPW